MVERYVRDVEVAGSNPVTSTRLSLDARRVPELGLFFCLFARAYSGHLICCPDPGGEPPLPSRELHFGEVRDFCCPRFLRAFALFSLAKPERNSHPKFGSHCLPQATSLPMRGVFSCAGFCWGRYRLTVTSSRATIPVKPQPGDARRHESGEQLCISTIWIPLRK